MIDLRLSGHVLQNTTQIFSAPEHISDGQAWGVDDLVTYLQRTGYRPDADENALGTYTIQGNTLDIRPSKLSFFAGGNALAVQFNGRVIRTIRPLGGGADMGTAEIQPELNTNLFASLRENLRPRRFYRLPSPLGPAPPSAAGQPLLATPGAYLLQ